MVSFNSAVLSAMVEMLLVPSKKRFIQKIMLKNAIYTQVNGEWHIIKVQKSQKGD